MSNCKTIRYNPSGEFIERMTAFWEVGKNSDTTYITLREKAWYKDSIGITEVCGIFTEETDTSRVTTTKTLKYRFIDLRKMWAYEYSSLVDTASLIRKFKCTDTARYTGGWNFANRTPFSVDSFKVLSDTVINGVTYKQCKVSYLFNEARFDGYGLARCDKKGTVFQVDTAMSNKIGCPLVYFKLHPRINSRSGVITQVDFISDNIPHSVAKVFTAWKKNENLYPVE